MMCFIHYWSACRRLEESEKTIRMLSGSKYNERDVPSQILAQRDFIKREKEYFGERSGWMLFLYFLIFLWLGIAASFYFKIGQHIT